LLLQLLALGIKLAFGKNIHTRADGLAVWLSIVGAVPGGSAALREYLASVGQLLTARRQQPQVSIESLFGNAPGEFTESGTAVKFTLGRTGRRS
jgi:hypothetical protein